jgi:hypothetical protein
MAAEGTAFVFLPSPAGRLSAERNLPVVPGSTLRTGTGGRTEIDLAPLATLRLSEGSEVDLARAAAGGWEAHLRRGKAHVETWADADSGPTIRTEFGDVIPRLRAQVSVTRATDGVIVDARDGIVEIRGGEGFATMLPSPGRIILRHGTPILSSAAPAGAPGRLRDDFMAWVERRQEERGPPAPSGSLWDGYGRELRAHGTFVRIDDVFGWTPTDPIDPLREGWSLTLSGDAVWVPRASWGWPTAHYGSWLSTEGRWLWIPGTTFQPGPRRVPRAPAPGPPHPLATAAAAR